jgi:CHASE1-domain containing sensor protein
VKLARKLGLALLVAVLAALPIVGFITERDRARDDRDEELSQLAGDLALTLQAGFDNDLGAVEAIAAFYNASGSQGTKPLEIGPKAFQVLVDDLSPSASFQALEYAPRVLRSRLGDFTELARSETVAGYTAHQKDGDELVPVTRRPEYYPVYMLDPVVGNEVALGFDLGSEQNRRAALRAAIRSGETTATAKITLVQETGTESATLLYSPVYRGGATPPTPDARRANDMGVALGVLRIGDAAQVFTGGRRFTALEYAIFDSPEPAPEALMVSTLGADPQPDDPSRLTTINVGGRPWLVVAWPNSAELSPAYTLSWALLVGGLIIVALILVVLFSQIRARRRAGALVT